MRKTLVSAALAVALVIGGYEPARAAPPAPAGSALPAGWSVEDGQLTWRSAQRVPMGDAAVEFWSGDRLLGRPRAQPDQRTFKLAPGEAGALTDLAVRSGGRRLDAAAPKAQRQAKARRQEKAQPANAVDPGLKGPYSTVRGEYALAGVKLPDYEQNVEMQAVVVAPKGAPGKRPLALFLHGRHSICYGGGDDDLGEWPCAAPSKPIPSYRGYLQAQELLASQGYVTVSISANGINGQDWVSDDGGAQARSSLVRLHLAKWADWATGGRGNAPAIVRSAPVADLSRVLLMGHSRGGDGVSRAAMDTLTPPPAAQDGYHGRVRWTIRGLLLIGPTIFGHDPVPDVPSATILPGCDGDVSDLQGQQFIDETRGVSRGRALHSSLYVVGANHNFFNTEWTPGQAVAPAWDDFWSDDQPDAVCSPGTPARLTAQQEQTVGATYIAAAARLFVAGDDRVRPLLDGSGARAASAGPASVYSHALGGVRTPVIVPDPSVGVTGAGKLCEQVAAEASKACLDPEDWTQRSAHFTSFNGITPEPGRWAVGLSGTGPVTLTPARPVATGGARELTLRLMVPPNTTGNKYAVSAIDSRGKRTALGEVRVDGLPGTEFTTSYWAREVRVPLKGVSGRIAKLELTPGEGAGRAWLIDAWAWNPGTPAPLATSLPRIDLGSLQVDEGDSGTKTYQVPVTITGRGAGRVRLFLVDGATYESTSWTADIRPGQRTIRVPVDVVGDTLFGEGEGEYLLAKAERGVVIGDWAGSIDIRNDDPMPAITVSPAAARVAEGGTLTWQVTLSAPTETGFYFVGDPEPPAGGNELSSTDVDPQWFLDITGEDPEPSRPLSGTWATPYVYFEPGQTAGDLSIPTVTDDLAEPEETVELHFDDSLSIPPVTGTVF
ncbi:hypothetical protein [Winogradskya humida]|uniref:Secreted protein n=1 Tax=Winogradskya humida TaxID=113566 RepID=A0ABQ4A1D3_9ACTN|nr:hypothetical protein [Actinoplanes humidus]GIE24666.1 hypothetical protein Ahu01nite_077680 [Actinoplanes humidus]